MAGIAPRLAQLVEKMFAAPPPVRIRAWDGSEHGPPGAPVLYLRSRRALRRILWRPGELGLARAWVAGELTVEGDLYEALGLVGGLLWERQPEQPHATAVTRPDGAPDSDLGASEAQSDTGVRGSAARRVLTLAGDATVRSAARELLSLAGPWPPPPPPPEENRRRTGLSHTLRRDRAAISHHYDVGNDFYSLVLGPSMVYSCAYWADHGDEGPASPAHQDHGSAVPGPFPGSCLPGPFPDSAGLDAAQYAKLDLICRKLALRPEQRLLDMGCGWGSLVLHAAREYGVYAVGVTLSQEQATYARKRIAQEGLTERVEVRVQDYREVPDGPYDAIASVGMAEHVGSARYREYADDLYALLRPGGRLLNHQIARRPQADESAYEIDRFIDAYVFPDGELSPVGRTVGHLEDAGFEVRDLQSLREHYALTLRAWVTNLRGNWAEAVRHTSPGRARVWVLYMAASALAFEHNRIGVNQILAVRTPPSGTAGLSLRARDWRVGA